MINHQSPYGQIIRIPSETYFKLLDEDKLDDIEDKYANSTKAIINFSGSCESDDEYIIDTDNVHIEFDTPERFDE